MNIYIYIYKNFKTEIKNFVNYVTFRKDFFRKLLRSIPEEVVSEDIDLSNFRKTFFQKQLFIPEAVFYCFSSLKTSQKMQKKNTHKCVPPTKNFKYGTPASQDHQIFKYGTTTSRDHQWIAQRTTTESNRKQQQPKPPKESREGRSSKKSEYRKREIQPCNT